MIVSRETDFVRKERHSNERFISNGKAVRTDVPRSVIDLRLTRGSVKDVGTGRLSYEPGA